MKMFLGILMSLFVISGCAPTVPPRTATQGDVVPALREDSARVYFYTGQWIVGRGSWVGLSENDLKIAGDVYINDQKIGYVNKEETIAVDLRSGTYDFHWFPTVSDLDKQHTFPTKLRVKVGARETLYLKGNWEDRTSMSAALLLGGYLAGAKFEAYLVSEQDSGRDKVSKLRLVEYKDLSTEVSSLEEFGDKEASSSQQEVKALKTPQDTSSTKSVEERLQDLKRMYEGKLITKEEYNTERKELLNEL